MIIIFYDNNTQIRCCEQTNHGNTARRQSSGAQIAHVTRRVEGCHACIMNLDGGEMSSLNDNKEFCIS